MHHPSKQSRLYLKKVRGTDAKGWGCQKRFVRVAVATEHEEGP